MILLDQDTINVVCNKKLGFFPSYFISYGICDLNYLNMINKENLNNNRIQDLKIPYIFHFFKIYTKPWYGFAKKGNFICYDFIQGYMNMPEKLAYIINYYSSRKIQYSNKIYAIGILIWLKWI